MTFGSLEWYLAAADSIDQIYQEELFRAPLPDNQALANWLFHAREEGKDADWIRARVRESDEWKQVHSHVDPSTIPLEQLARIRGAM